MQALPHPRRASLHHSMHATREYSDRFPVMLQSIRRWWGSNVPEPAVDRCPPPSPLQATPRSQRRQSAARGRSIRIDASPRTLSRFHRAHRHNRPVTRTSRAPANRGPRRFHRRWSCSLRCRMGCCPPPDRSRPKSDTSRIDRPRPTERASDPRWLAPSSALRRTRASA